MANIFAKLFRRGQNGARGLVIYQLGEVFTPSRPANKVFIPRTQQEDDLKGVLMAPGTQVLIWGESGAGKSSIALKVLQALGRKYYVTKCDGSSTYESILASGFAQSRETMLDRSTIHDTATMTGGTEIGGSASLASFKAEGSYASGHARDQVPVVQTQKTAESLAEIFGRLGAAWIIDDFHKVDERTRDAIADAMKVFSDESFESAKTVMIVLGASDSPAAIVGTPSNMKDRLASIELPPLNDDELGAILDEGGELLNVDFGPVRDRIIRNSVGVAQITHGLAFETCRALGVEQTSAERRIVDGPALDRGRATYTRTRTGSMKADFDKALRVEVTRRFHNHAIILKALAELPEAGATHAEILALIRKTHSDYPTGNLTQYLQKLQEDKRGALVRKTTHNTFRYNQPLQHAYAMDRFGVEAGTSFWNNSLGVRDAERRESVRLTEEVIEGAPVEPE